MPPVFSDGKPVARGALPSGSGTFTASAAVAVDTNVTSTTPSAVRSPPTRRERVEMCMRIPSSYGDQDSPGRVVPVQGPYGDGEWRQIGSDYPDFAVCYPDFLGGELTSGGEPVRSAASLAERGGHHVRRLARGRERLDDLCHRVVRVVAVCVRELAVLVLDDQEP